MVSGSIFINDMPGCCWGHINTAMLILEAVLKRNPSPFSYVLLDFSMNQQVQRYLEPHLCLHTRLVYQGEGQHGGCRVITLPWYTDNIQITSMCAT